MFSSSFEQENLRTEMRQAAREIFQQR